MRAWEIGPQGQRRRARWDLAQPWLRGQISVSLWARLVGVARGGASGPFAVGVARGGASGPFAVRAVRGGASGAIWSGLLAVEPR